MFLASQILLALRNPTEALAKQLEDQAQTQTTQAATLRKQHEDLYAFVESQRRELADAAILENRAALHRRALEQARPHGPLRRDRGIHMWAAGCGRDAHSVHSLVVVQRWRKGRTERGPNIAAVRAML